MDFENGTNFHTLLHRCSIGEDLIAMAVMCRISYDVDNEGNLTIAENQEWPLEQSYYENEYGPMDKDDVYTRGGVDLMVFGNACAPEGREVNERDVAVSLNSVEIHRIKVFGDRYWKSFMGIMTKTSPASFKKIPLTLQNAFGGIASWDGLKIPYSANPYGKGYYQTKEEAVGGMLPNIENPNMPIMKWREFQDPAGMAMNPILPLKAKYNIEYDKGTKQIKRVNEKFFNAAFPEMIVKSIKPNDAIKIIGATPEPTFLVIVPQIPLEIEIIIGENFLNEILQYDQIGIEPEKKKAFITYRFPFRYNVRPKDKRITTLKMKTY